MSETSDLIGIKRYGLSGLSELLAEWGEPRFRAKQLVKWLYGNQGGGLSAHGSRGDSLSARGSRGDSLSARGSQGDSLSAHGNQSDDANTHGSQIDDSNICTYEHMSNLSQNLRKRLTAEQPLARPTVVKRQLSKDGARKYLLRLADGALIETVGIPDDGRLTVCFSTQVGCAMACSFCETGRRGLSRSLWPGEMADQLLVVAEDMGRRVTNAVAMGEGEPFANYQHLMDGLCIMNSPDALNIGARHITVSTCGVLSGVAKFAQEPEQFTLAISLHSAVQATRDLLMPALTSQPLGALRQRLIEYAAATGRRPSLEVTLIDGVNDGSAEVAALIDFARGLLCHVNLIALNRGVAEDVRGDKAYKPSSAARCREIAEKLVASGIQCSIRRSRGADISAACGQLKGQEAGTS